LKYFIALFIFLVIYILSPDIYAACSIAVVVFLVYRILMNSNRIFVFREWTLLLYAINYLIATIITYNLPEDKITYGMKIPYEHYFSLALPGFLFFALGMLIIPTKVFLPDFKNVSKISILNERFLLFITFLGIGIRLIESILPEGVGFIFYLFGLIRFVGAFALFASNPRKNYPFAVIVILLELIFGFIAGMYHDALMWLIFFLLFYLYSNKPNITVKVFGAVILIFFVLFVQAIKFTYRQEVWQGAKEANFNTISEVGESKLETDILLGEDNLISTLSRGNQAWIFASTVDNMDQKKSFQGLTNVNKYLESALLPRFLAPNKLTSGNREIFNDFSGHIINEGTSMGLGIFAGSGISIASIFGPIDI